MEIAHREVTQLCNRLEWALRNIEKAIERGYPEAARQELFRATASLREFLNELEERQQGEEGA